MQRQRSSLVFDPYARQIEREANEPGPQPVERRGRVTVIPVERDPAVAAAALGAMQPGRRALPRGHQPVDIDESAAADQRQRALVQLGQVRQEPRQVARHLHLLGARRDLQQCAVDIDKQRRAAIEERRSAVWNIFVRRTQPHEVVPARAM